MVPELIELNGLHYPIYWRRMPGCPMPVTGMEVFVRADPEGPVYRAHLNPLGEWKILEHSGKGITLLAWAYDPKITGAIPIQYSKRNPTGQENQIYALDQTDAESCDLCDHEFGLDDVGYLVGPGHSPHDGNARQCCVDCLDEDAFLVLGAQILNSRMLRALSRQMGRVSPARVRFAV